VEDGILHQQGAQEPAPDKFTSLATIRMIGGLQTQRSPFAGIDTRSGIKFYGGKPDALIAGSNCEISNRLTLYRRPGLIAYGVSNIPSPVFFYDYELATTQDIILTIDTATSGGDNLAGSNGAVFNYSPTHSGIYINKSPLSKQTNFYDIVNTMYMGDGVDLFKNVGPNLLTQSNTFGIGAGTSFSVQSPWTEANLFAVTGGQPDPLGTDTATQIVWGTTGATAYLKQFAGGGDAVTGSVVPNYTPVASNTFTFSIWLKMDMAYAETVTIQIIDQSGTIASQVCPLTSSWVKWQVTGTMLSSSTQVGVAITDPTTANYMFIYGTQLEVGGPATTTQVTTTKPQGVYLWGIQAPVAAPTFTTTAAVGTFINGNPGKPWQPNFTYHVGDTIIDTNGNLQYATDAGIYPELNLVLSAAGNASMGSTIYTGVFPNGASNAYAGVNFTVTGFVAHTANNGFFLCTASTTTQLTLSNASGSAETHVAQAAASVPGTVAGESGSSAPLWNVNLDGITLDGIQNVLVQSTTSTAGTIGQGQTASLTMPSNVTANNSLVVAIYVSHPHSLMISDTQSNTYVNVLGSAKPPQWGSFVLYLYIVESANAGATTINVTGGGSTGTYMAAAELSDITGLDAGGSSVNSNESQGNGSSFFTTGGITTTNPNDLILTIGAFNTNSSSTVGAGSEVGDPPSTYEILTSDAGVPFNFGTTAVLFNMTMAILPVTVPDFYNPNWSIINSQRTAAIVGITASLKTSVGTLQWVNLGTTGAGLTTTLGYQYYIAYGNSYTGHLSNVSPISGNTGVIVGSEVVLSGAVRPMVVGAMPFTSALYNTDPQSDLIYVFRNTDGGPLWFQDAVFGNGAAAQAALLAANYPGLATTVTYSGSTFQYTDDVSDADLNTDIFAPIADLNSLPPAGLKNMDFFAGRMWASVGNLLYYSTGPDNAQLLGVEQNGVAAESWIGDNVVPFNSYITRIFGTSGGLLVATVTDLWFVTGQNLLQGGFNPQKILIGHGLRSYNALGVDGSTLYIYTSDREMLSLNPQSGSVEVGYPVGDTFELTYSPINAYLVRHVSGSRDNAVYFADGSSSWYRLNPNQQGASIAGEATPVWSPQANFTSTIGGIAAIASIETAAGVTQLLVGLPPLNASGIAQAGPVLVRSLSTFSDNGVPFNWTATVGSIMLATPGKVAETESVTTEMNNSGINGAYSTQCLVSVLLDEIAGSPENLPNSVNDPPAPLAPTVSVLGQRFYLNQADDCPVCRHIQITVSGGLNADTGGYATTQDELLGLSVRAALMPESL
jgi:hypothetical protein